MKRLDRRSFLVTAGTALLLSTSMAAAQDFPSRPINIIVPYAPGGQGDVTARLIAEHLPAAIGQSVTVENRSGANGVIGISALSQAEPDGHTIGLVVASHAMARALVANLPYDPIEDFKPITTTALTEMVMVVSNNVEATTVQEFVSLAKSQPGKYAYKSAGPGSNSHLFGAWFSDAAGLEMIHIPYKGSGDSMPDFLSGVVHLGFDTVPAVRGYIDAGQIKVLAAGGRDRSAAYPDVPTVEEAGVEGFAANSWGMVLAPKDTPDNVIKTLNEAIVQVLNLPEVKEKFATMGAQVVANSPDDALAMLKREEQTYTDLITRLEITLPN